VAFFIFVYGTYGAITYGAKTNFGLKPKIKQKTYGALFLAGGIGFSVSAVGFLFNFWLRPKIKQ
jgi:hypothetical protein